MKLKRVGRPGSGVYETHDGKFQVQHWNITAGNRKSWAISDILEDGSVGFICEVETLGDARDYLDGKHVFIMS